MTDTDVSASTTEEAGTGPKVLRIGIIQGGKIIEERRLKRRETVSIGQSPKATFSLSSQSVPRSFDLFEYTGSEYYLRFLEGMDGRIQGVDGATVADLAALKAKNELTQRGDAFAVRLTDDSRGKVMLGDVTVLFQFVAPPPAPAKPILPADARGSLLSNLDVQFASIFAGTAVLLISLVSYARSLPYIEPSTVEQLGERYQKMIMPDRIPEPPKDATADASKGKDKQKEADKGKEKKPDANASKGKGKKTEEKPVSAEEAARAKKEALTKQVAGKGLLGVIGTTRGGKNSAIADVFSDGGGFDGALGDAMSGIQGVDIASGSGERGTRGGGSGKSADIGSLATSGGGNVSVGGKTEAAVKGNVKMSEAPEVEGDLSKDAINSVMKRQVSALKDCYERELKRTPNLQGKIVLSFEILETGRVNNAQFVEDNVGSPAVKACILDRARFWRFPKPQGGSVQVSFPLVFTPAG